MEWIDILLAAVGFVLIAAQLWVAYRQVEIARIQADASVKQAQVSHDLLELERKRDQAVLQVSWLKGISDNRILEATVRNVGGRTGRLEHIMASWQGMREDADWRPPGTKVAMHLGGISLVPVALDKETKTWRDIEPPEIPPGNERKIIVALGPGAPGNLGTKGFPLWKEPQLMTLKPSAVVGVGDEKQMKVWWPRHELWVREQNAAILKRLKHEGAGTAMNEKSGERRSAAGEGP